MEPDWTTTPTKTGAYWMKLPDADADICWIHDGKLWFLPKFSYDWETPAEYVAAGCVFWGPIPTPPGPTNGKPQG